VTYELEIRESFAVVFGWFFFQVLLYYIVPAQIVKGTVIRDGTQLDYRINGEIFKL
jgi:hypothetical protein